MRLLAKTPVGKLQADLSTGGTPVGLASWVQIIASTPAPCCAVEMFNSTGSILRISTGSAGNELAGELPYYVLPNGSPILLPWEIPKGSRISVLAVDTATTAGRIILNLFG